MTEGQASDRVIAYDPERYRRVFVESDDMLKRVVQELHGAEALGVDLEMGQRVERRPGGVQEWKHILALIQIATPELSVVVDPLRCKSLEPLGSLLSSKTRKVFLGGGQDIALLDLAGIPAKHIVDVGEIALSIWGRREDGMAALARRMFGLSLDKTVRRADWLARPLNPALRTYAFQDAELTLLIYTWLRAHYPDEVTYHERPHLDPPFPPSTPAWLEQAMKRQPLEAAGSLTDAGLQIDRDKAHLEDSIRELLRAPLSPRQLSRLLRLVGETQLTGLSDDIVPLFTVHSATVRAAACRAMGVVGDPDSTFEYLERAQLDPSEEVRKAAVSAMKELSQAARAGQVVAVESDEGSWLAPDALAQLQAMKERLAQDHA